MSNYDDIIDLPHHTSSKHIKMSRESRAAQFSPFAALTGYDAEIDEAARLTDEQLILDEDQVNDLNSKLQYLKDNISDKPEIRIEYFIPDSRKTGGKYILSSGTVRIIDEYERSVVFYDGRRILIDDIFKIELIENRNI